MVIKVGEHFFNYGSDSDDQDLLYIINWNRYYRSERALIADYVNKSDTVVDVGANLGFFTILLSNLVGPNGKIFSFEPSKKTFKALSENIKINNIRNVIMENSGCGDIEGTFSLSKDGKFSGMDHIIVDKTEVTNFERIDMIKLDNYFESFNGRINLIKIDTEGYEPNVLKGAVKLINSFHPVLVVELSRTYLQQSVDAKRIISEMGYRIENNEVSIENAPSGTNFVCRYVD